MEESDLCFTPGCGREAESDVAVNGESNPFCYHCVGDILEAISKQKISVHWIKVEGTDEYGDHWVWEAGDRGDGMIAPTH